ncbi:hypothetical protein P6709_12185 [Jeotgalibacillus sp. ET6]|uniref:hypothetical protein n=1 Tax=Jeotgalibacillus sp. ET6 TaxID=3037260 RepID=UPI0024184A84|nr:hypothetical protein [Jeotgalibacillus sp. ET6]MDG5472505.1 hypothetical protein [Jeotgalibacillus sp. ET6]
MTTIEEVKKEGERIKPVGQVLKFSTTLYGLSLLYGIAFGFQEGIVTGIVTTTILLAGFAYLISILLRERKRYRKEVEVWKGTILKEYLLRQESVEGKILSLFSEYDREIPIVENGYQPICIEFEEKHGGYLALMEPVYVRIDETIQEPVIMYVELEEQVGHDVGEDIHLMELRVPRGYVLNKESQ